MTKEQAQRISLDQEADFHKRGYYECHKNCDGSPDRHKACEEIYQKWIDTIAKINSLSKTS